MEIHITAIDIKVFIGYKTRLKCRRIVAIAYFLKSGVNTIHSHLKP